MRADLLQRLSAVLARLPEGAAGRVIVCAVDRFAVAGSASMTGLVDEALVKYVERFTAGELCEACGMPFDGTLARARAADLGALLVRGLPAEARVIFAIDFDGTWTRAPRLLFAFAAAARAEGHTTILVTGRSDKGRWGAEVRREVGDIMPIVFAAGGWKRDALLRWLETEGRTREHVIWVDDQPEYVAAQDQRLIVGRPPFDPGAPR